MLRSRSVLGLVILLVVALSGASMRPSAETPTGPKSDWVVLFDGETLNGWIQKNGTATYEV